ncbi:hypothetical protein H5410_051666 [Solanum commersonii]|uniref:Uncharacterized protein n=1 Tax=Solanum commersonii TaxID=4109 RepID=A0A9J5X052_SOLCO|nr:hypothetical protein H5410_051666 [Solanum commersonii]
MAPKAKNVVGSKRSRKGEPSRSQNQEPVWKFGKKAVERYGWEWFDCQRESKYMGDEYIHEGIEEDAVDLTIAFHLDLMGKLVDVTQTKSVDTSHGTVLSAQDRQARDDSVMARMFGMAELQLRMEGRRVTDEGMENLADRYPLTESAASLYKTGSTFLELLDNDKATVDEVMDDKKDDAYDEEANALMIFMAITYQKQSAHEEELIPQEEENLDDFASLLAGFLRNGYVEATCRTSNEMLESDLVSWNTMIGGFIKQSICGCNLSTSYKARIHILLPTVYALGGKWTDVAKPILPRSCKESGRTSQWG